MTTKRELSAIMFADIEGFTAIMENNEAEGLALRAKHREVLGRLIEKHKGELVQYYGDGSLSTFRTGKDAVHCAAEIQSEMQVPPKLPLRIGIHSGAIVRTEDGIAGDNVNIASRVENIGVPGSILVTEQVANEVKSDPEIELLSLGSYKLKNVSGKVGVFAVRKDNLVVPSRRDIVHKLESRQIPRWVLPSVAGSVLLLLFLSFWFGVKLDNDGLLNRSFTVAVLPFDIVGNTQDEAYLATGTAEGLIHEVSRIDKLRVIHPSSTRVLAASVAGGNISFAESTSGADYFVGGNVGRKGTEFEIDVTLSDALEAEPFWSKHYTRDVSDMRRLWGSVAADVAVELGVRVAPEVLESWSSIRPVDPKTYDLYLKGMHYLNKSDPTQWPKGLAFFEQAIAENPSDPFAYAGLAEAYIRLGHGPAPPPDVFPKALEAATRSIQLDSTLADGWAALCHYQTYFGWDWQLADETFHRSNEINPSLAWNHYHRAWYMALFGRMDEAIEEHLIARDLDPFTPEHTAWLGELYRWVGEYEKAFEMLDAANELEDNFAIGDLIRGWIYADLKDWENAEKYHRQATQKNPGWRYVGLGPTLLKSGKKDEGLQVLAELEAMPQSPFSQLMLAAMYSILDDTDKCIEALSYPEKHGWYPWIRVMFIEGETRNDPRFLALIRDMGLPDPAPLRYTPES